MANMEARLVLSMDMSWGDIKAEADRIGVPNNASMKLHTIPYVNPVDPGYEELVWKWER